MNSINYVKDVLKVDITPYQKELLIFIETNPKGYIREALSKNPCFYVRQVVELWNKYEQEYLAAV
jgi:hypothetical protein